MTKTPDGIFLDIDSSIVEENLRFINDPNEENINKLLQPFEERAPSKLVKPFPGFCVKTKEIGLGAKLFINICHTDAIPAPKNISESELQDILNSEEQSSFRVPMSIGEIRVECDKMGEEAKVCDIAIHPDFLRKVEEIQLFKNFLMSIVFEAIKDKYGIVCVDDKILLKNRKAFGTLQVHRIQQRDIEQKMGTERNSIGDDAVNNDRNPSTMPLIETISSSQSEAAKTPDYKLFRRKCQPNCLIGEFRFNGVVSASELILDIGEDRILMECNRLNYLLDIFLPHIVRQNSCSAHFNKSTKILTVMMPLVGG